MSSEIDESSLQDRQATETNEGRGILFVVSAPSGGGKGTLIQRVLKQVPNLSYSVSFTTRAPRNGEVDGREYFFVTPDKFQQMVDAGEFLEWAHVHSKRYGTARQQVAAIWKAVEQLPEGQRTVFLLRFVEEMEILEIAAATGLKEGTVKIHLFRALKTIRARIAAKENV